jgi:AraC-like DNA-binding protein
MFEQSKKISREHRRMFEELRAIVECGNHHLRCGDTAESRTCFEEAYRLSMEIGAELYCARLSKLLGIHERDEKTPIERHLGKERHVMLAQQARDILLIADEKTLFDAILTAAMDFMGARSGCLFDENAQSICFKGMENARVQQMQQVLASHLKREKEIYTIDRDMRHQMAFPVFTSREQLGICIIENPFLEQGFSAKDIPAVVSFLEIVSQALSRLRSTEIVDIPSKEAISSATKQKVAKAIEYIQKNYTSDISREGLAASLDINPDHLGKAFKVITGEKIGDFINRLRIEEAAKRLAEGKEKIIDIAYGVGFESLSTFNRSFAKIMEVSPQDYRKRKMK